MTDEKRAKKIYKLKKKYIFWSKSPWMLPIMKYSVLIKFSLLETSNKTHLLS